jgi:hypothetical protein
MNENHEPINEFSVTDEDTYISLEDLPFDPEHSRIPQEVQLLFKLADEHKILDKINNGYFRPLRIDWERNWKLLQIYYSTDKSTRIIMEELPQLKYKFKTPQGINYVVKMTLQSIHAGLVDALGLENLPAEIRDFENIPRERITSKKGYLNQLVNKIPDINQMLSDFKNPQEIFKYLNVDRKYYGVLRSETIRQQKPVLPIIYDIPDWVEGCIINNKNIQQAFDFISTNNMRGNHDTLHKKGLIISFTDVIVGSNTTRTPEPEFFMAVSDHLRENNIPTCIVFGSVEYKQTYYFLPAFLKDKAIEVLPKMRKRVPRYPEQ